MTRVPLGALVACMLALTGSVAYHSFLGPDKACVPDQTVAVSDDCCCTAACPLVEPAKTVAATPDCCDEAIPAKSTVETKKQ